MEDRRLEASRLVDEIRVDGGGATPEDIKFLRDHRPAFLKTFLNLQEQVGKSAKIFSEQLNSKDTHFVYELIQNAEDNKCADGVEPFLKFTLEDERLIVDANEKGFTQENIKAISRIGSSTKIRKTGFIGEKGIGFKSIFRVARKVHIQSEPFSFAFIYEDDDNGLGMVTPLNEPYLHVPSGVQTRMIMYLRDKKDLGLIQKELRNLPNTLLLFLKKLRRLEVQIVLRSCLPSSASYSLKQTDDFNSNDRLTIMRNLGVGRPTEHHFWVKRRRVHGMPNHASRPEIDEAEIILAFPLDKEDEPIIENQWISAYLPMRKEAFKFLIQSDFIMAANRQDVLDCTWNDRLLDAIAENFVSAAEDHDGFLNHRSLRFSWVRYIPTNRTAHQIWGRLQKSIMQRLEDRRLFFSHTCSSDVNYTNDDQHRRTAKQLRIVGQQYRDDQMAALLPDLSRGPSTYISGYYNVQLDLPVLRKLGTIDLSMSPDFLDRLSEDLGHGFYSRWKSIDFASDWFTRISKRLLEASEDLVLRKAIQRLPLVPLHNGRWVPSLNASIFLPTSGGIAVPEGLPLNLVKDTALSKPSLKGLLMGLGIAECRPDQVILLIEQRYTSSGSWGISTLVQDIVFLFWHHDKIPKLNYKIFLCMVGKGTKFYWSNVDTGGWLYESKADHPYALGKLLDDKVPAGLEGQFSFVMHQYFEALEACGTRHGKLGRDWLQQRAGVKLTPQLPSRKQKSVFDRSAREMSPEFKFIAENMPHYLLRILRHKYVQFEQSEEWDSYIKAREVPILDCPYERPLETTFLPLPSLLRTVHELGLRNQSSFLEELDGMKEVESVKWDFLGRFGVGVKADLNFWSTLLHGATQCRDVQKTSIFRIYAQIQTFIYNGDIQDIRRIFESADLIYIPVTDDEAGDWEWAGLEDVVWDGPEWVTMMQALDHLPQYKLLVNLFVNILDLSDVTIEHCLQSLTLLYLKKEYHKIPLLYSKIVELWQSEGRNEQVKDEIISRFELERLIWDPASQEWYSSASCTWAEDSIVLPNKVSLATTYKDHLFLFRDILDIKKPSLEMHIASLVDKAAENPDKHFASEDWRLPMFPDKGSLWRNCLASHSSTFAIVDRKEYATMFQGKIRTLEFSLEEVHSISTFLTRVGLDKRLLSQAVTEETKVENSRPAGDLTRDLKLKAYAIARYAAYLRAPDPLTIFARLQELEVFTSDKISRTCSIQLGSKTTSVPTDVAYFHLDSSDGHLKLYVPQGEENQQVCLMRQLPIALLRHFGALTPSRGAELGAILTARSLIVVDTILEQDGVIDVVGISRPDVNELNGTIQEIESNANSAISASASYGIVQRPGLTRALDSGYADIPTTTSHLPEHEEDRDFTDRVERPDLFCQLIHFVIEQANLIQNLPAKGAQVVASRSSASAFEHGLALNLHHYGQGSRQIGAVGELFIFTLLSKLALPNFTRACWKSTIRHLVSVHETYSDLDRWIGAETSDIVYTDTQSALNQLLIRQGYLASASWANRTPTYYIEVKTTMSDEARPFYCSQAQFDRMEDNELPEDGSAATEVYLIARVFGLGGSRMGLKLYLDPWKMRRNRELRFEAQVYSVTPS